eukprot:13815808-Heterocapsa_arctica.AAC.1
MRGERELPAHDVTGRAAGEARPGGGEQRHSMAGLQLCLSRCRAAQPQRIRVRGSRTSRER